MNKYLLSIKSHIDTSDYEDEIIAHNKAEAINIFYRRCQGEFNHEFIKKNVSKEAVRIIK